MRVCVCVHECMVREEGIVKMSSFIYIAESSGWQDLVYTGEMAL